MSNAIAPVAAEIMPGRPPTNAITTAIQNEAYRPTLGSTPAIIENAIASGMSANATTIPANRSPLILENHSSFIFSSIDNLIDKFSDNIGMQNQVALATEFTMIIVRF
uniref:Uncharacterized protein n=1 Tax=Providencia rettgeri TaxID=587 RepID=Q8RKZ9_PRORE|nr:hypothetical protein [Providencia rettgeri]